MRTGASVPKLQSPLNRALASLAVQGSLMGWLAAAEECHAANLQQVGAVPRLVEKQVVCLS